MGLLSFVVFGLIVGLVANAIDPRPAEGGALGAMVLGVLGAIVGGFLAGTLLGIGVTGFNLTSFIVALCGAGLLLMIGRAIRRA